MSDNSERQNERDCLLGSLQHAHLLSGANSESKIKNFWRSPALSTKLHSWLCPILLLVALVTASGQQARVASQNGKTVMQIDAGWQFREAGKTDWYNATGPGCVHTDLLANKLIEDPFYRDNEKKQQWIDKKDWEYETAFEVTAATLAHENVELVFEGLDTYAQVYVNEQPLLNADNMFRTWRVNVKPALKPGANTLRILFRSPVNEILPVMAQLDYKLPAPNDQGEKTSPFTRKAPYQYGWGLGASFVTSGIGLTVSVACCDHAQGALSVGRGLRPAVCHERHLAAGVAASLGSRARRQPANHREEHLA